MPRECNDDGVKTKTIIFFLLAAVLAGTAGFLTLQKVKELNNDLGTMANVYAANGEIASRSIITPKDIKVEKRKSGKRICSTA